MKFPELTELTEFAEIAELAELAELRWTKCHIAHVMLGRRHFVHLSLACVLSLAIFGVLLQSWELCLVLGLASILSLANF